MPEISRDSEKGGGGGGGGGDSRYLLGAILKSGFFSPLRIFSLKRSIAGALAVPFRVLSRKKT